MKPRITLTTIGVDDLERSLRYVNNLMAAETMELDDQRLITRVLAHYAPK
ncbi:MAG: hypothetical protein KF784_16105 [Fimbriimonadaceae bacterium]|nr:hypothetical protein [Fimbriimonadaceae bacterium]MDR4465994.1 hypothetical protein [Nitrospira sp.]MDR4467952.1 hypothetical protein [Nitrospira sp.]